MEPKWITMRAAGQILGVSRTTLDRMAADGRLTKHKLGPSPKHPVRLDENEVRALLAATAPPEVSEPEVRPYRPIAWS